MRHFLKVKLNFSSRFKAHGFSIRLGIPAELMLWYFTLAMDENPTNITRLRWGQALLFMELHWLALMHLGFLLMGNGIYCTIHALFKNEWIRFLHATFLQTLYHLIFDCWIQEERQSNFVVFVRKLISDQNSRSKPQLMPKNSVIFVYYVILIVGQGEHCKAKNQYCACTKLKVDSPVCTFFKSFWV